MSYIQNKENLVDFINKHGNLVLIDWISIQDDFFQKTGISQNTLKLFGDALLVEVKSVFLIEIFGDQIAQKLLSFDQTQESEKNVGFFLDLLVQKQVDVNTFSKVFLDLQNSFVDNLNQKPGYLSYINASVTILNKIFIDVLKLYNQKFFVLLNEYKNAIDTSNIVCKFGLDGRISYVNEKFCFVFGQEEGELVGKDYFNIVKIIDKEIDKEFIFGLIAKKHLRTGQIIIGQKYLICNILPILNDSGKKTEYIAIATDITNQKILELKVKKQAKQQLQDKEKIIFELQKISKSKDEFLNIASHELRTPMSVIQGYISMLLAGDAGEINDEVKNYLDNIMNSSQRLINLINDMLDIAKLEAGRMEFFWEEFPLKEFLEEIFIGMSQLSKKKSQKFSFIIHFDERAQIKSDKIRLKQILENIISNAIKFTQSKGSIKIECFVQNNFFIAKVSDNGIGISQESIPQIFEKFSQVKNSLTRDISGTGLGLSIVKKNLEGMKGMVFVESELKKGSTFTISVPMDNS